MPNEVFAKIFEVIVARTWMVSIVQTSARKLKIISPKSSNDNTSWPEIVWLLSFIFGSLKKRDACSFDWFFDFDSVFISIRFRFRRSPKSSVRDAIVDYLFRIAFVCFHLRFVEVRSRSNERLKLRLKIKFRVRSAGHENSNREGWRFRTAVKLNGFRCNTTGSLETMASDKLRDYSKGLMASPQRSEKVGFKFMVKWWKSLLKFNDKNYFCSRSKFKNKLSNVFVFEASEFLTRREFPRYSHTPPETNVAEK